MTRPRIDADCRTGDGYAPKCNARPGVGYHRYKEYGTAPVPTLTIDAELSRILSTHPIGSAEGVEALAQLRKRAEGMVKR